MRVDPLQRLHTLHNLHTLLEEGVEGEAAGHWEAQAASVLGACLLPACGAI